MDLREAAHRLYSSLAMPPGSANVLTDPDHDRLIVWLDASMYSVRRTEIPQSYEGYPVIVERRPVATAYS